MKPPDFGTRNRTDQAKSRTMKPTDLLPHTDQTSTYITIKPPDMVPETNQTRYLP
jgi:hypothetical protein